MVLTLTGWAALAATVVALVVRQFPWTWQPLIMLATFAHWVLLAAPVAVLLLVVVRRWATAVCAALAALLAAATQVPLYVASAPSAHGPAMTVMQANLGFGAADPANVVRLVTTRHVDVLATEELTFAARDRLLDAGLGRLLPYRFDAALPTGGGGLAIWSRYPLRDEVNEPHFELGVLTARTTLPSGERLNLLAVHLLPPWPYPSAEWLSETTRLRAMLAAAAQDGSAVVVAGDFNATTDHARFRSLLSGGYRDGAEQVGAGYLPTYPTDRWFPPLVALDHVLTRGAAVTDLSTASLPGSDHRAMLARVRLRG